MCKCGVVKHFKGLKKKLIYHHLFGVNISRKTQVASTRIFLFVQRLLKGEFIKNSAHSKHMNEAICTRGTWLKYNLIGCTGEQFNFHTFQKSCVFQNISPVPFQRIERSAKHLRRGECTCSAIFV